MSDLKLERLLARIDAWATASGIDGDVPPPHRFEPTRVAESPPLGLDFRTAGIRTVIWACGFRPDYTWLHVPVLDRKGRIRHEGGVAESPGLYVLGLPFLRRRKSSLIDGAAVDANDLADHLVRSLGREAVPGGTT
jgi:putative flavoprotein involved in K+ transport